MKLESARELKRMLVKKAMLAPAAAGLRMAAAVPARAMAGLDARPTVALGVAPSRRGGYALAVRIQQRALEGSRQVDLIVQQAKGEVDVRYIGRAVKRAVPWYRQRCRPLRIGCSVGHYKVTAGTLGCFVRPRGGGGRSASSPTTTCWPTRTAARRATRSSSRARSTGARTPPTAWPC